MREILYRAISMATGEHWLYGQPRHYARNPHTEKWTIYDPKTGIETDIDEETLGQYTGLQDKNDNKIFEGDIIKCNNKVEEYIGLVDWDACNPSMCIRFKSENGFNYVEYDFIKCGNMTIEILGNRWDNPELLKGGRTIKVFKITFETEAGCNDLSPFDEVDIYTKDIVERFDGRNIEVEEIGGTK